MNPKYAFKCLSVSVSCSVMSDSLQPVACSPWDSPRKNTRVGCHFLIRGIFQPQGWNPNLFHLRIGRRDLYHERRLGKCPFLLSLINHSPVGVLLSTCNDSFGIWFPNCRSDLPTREEPLALFLINSPTAGSPARCVYTAILFTARSACSF